MPETEFGRRLAKLRKEAALSQSELADKSGVSLAGIRMLEQGHRQPTWATVQALAKALSMPYSAFETTSKRKRK
jgi:transcriptional regulator with XRE-family HTH domain